MKVYISGPITGYPNGNAEAFGDAEDSIRWSGHEPVNPHKLTHDHGKTWAEFMREDIKALLDCQAIFMLKGWWHSKGAVIENKLAQELGIILIDSVVDIPKP